MCPLSKSPVLHDADLGAKRIIYPKHIGRPSWAKKAQEEVGQKRNHPSNMTSNVSIFDSIIGNINPSADVCIIFLDVDGVINHPNSDNAGTTICPHCVNKLKTMLGHTSANIVLSSTWRLNKHHRKTLFRHLRAINVYQGVVVGETRDLRKGGKNRAEEINDWISNPKLYKKKGISSLLPFQIQSWVSLDDLDLASLQPNMHVRNRHIKLDPKLGLCGTDNIVTTVVQRLLKTRARGMNASELENTVTYMNTKHNTEGSLCLTGQSCVQWRGVMAGNQGFNTTGHIPLFEETYQSHFKKMSVGLGCMHNSMIGKRLVELGEKNEISDDEHILSTSTLKEGEDNIIRGSTESRSVFATMWTLINSSSKSHRTSNKSVIHIPDKSIL